MQPQEFEDAKLLWKKYYAVQCFKHAQVAAEYILQNKIAEDDPVFFPLITAVYVLYGRPFKRTKGVGVLGKEIIPQEHLELHQSILDHRDQIYAHSDAIGFELADVGQANSPSRTQFSTARFFFRRSIAWYEAVFFSTLGILATDFRRSLPSYAKGLRV
jgi:hypothetical protein